MDAGGRFSIVRQLSEESDPCQRRLVKDHESPGSSEVIYNELSLAGLPVPRIEQIQDQLQAIKKLAENDRHFLPVLEIHKSTESLIWIEKSHDLPTLASKIDIPWDEKSLHTFISELAEALDKYYGLSGGAHGNLSTRSVLIRRSDDGTRFYPILTAFSFLESTAGDEAYLNDLHAIGRMIAGIALRENLDDQDLVFPLRENPLWRSFGKKSDFWKQLASWLIYPDLTLEQLNIPKLRDDLRPRKKFPVTAAACCAAGILMAALILPLILEKTYFKISSSTAVAEDSAGARDISRGEQPETPGVSVSREPDQDRSEETESTPEFSPQFPPANTETIRDNELISGQNDMDSTPNNVSPDLSDIAASDTMISQSKTLQSDNSATSDLSDSYKEVDTTTETLADISINKVSDTNADTFVESNIVVATAFPDGDNSKSEIPVDLDTPDKELVLAETPPDLEWPDIQDAPNTSSAQSLNPPDPSDTSEIGFFPSDTGTQSGSPIPVAEPEPDPEPESVLVASGNSTELEPAIPVDLPTVSETAVRQDNILTTTTGSSIRPVSHTAPQFINPSVSVPEPAIPATTAPGPVDLLNGLTPKDGDTWISEEGLQFVYVADLPGSFIDVSKRQFASNAILRQRQRFPHSSLAVNPLDARSRMQMDTSGPASQLPPPPATMTNPLPDGAFICLTEIPQNIFSNVNGDNPSIGGDDTSPVNSVAWSEAHEFCVRLTAINHERLGGRWRFALPTAAQISFLTGIDDLTGNALLQDGNENMLSGEILSIQGQKRSSPESVTAGSPANRYGLFHLIGNMQEWAYDDESRRAVATGWPYDFAGNTRKNPFISSPNRDRGDRRISFRCLLVPVRQPK